MTPYGKLIAHIEGRGNLTGVETRCETEKLVKELGLAEGMMECPQEAYIRLMDIEEERKNDIDDSTIEVTQEIVTSCCGHVSKMAKPSRSVSIRKGPPRTLQEAIEHEYSTEVRDGLECGKCKTLTEVTVTDAITSTGEHILIHYIGWTHSENDWGRIDITGRGNFAITHPEGGENIRKNWGGVLYG